MHDHERQWDAEVDRAFRRTYVNAGIAMPALLGIGNDRRFSLKGTEEDVALAGVCAPAASFTFFAVYHRRHIYLLTVRHSKAGPSSDLLTISSFSMSGLVNG